MVQGPACPFGHLDGATGNGPCAPNPDYLGQSGNAPRGDKTSTTWAQNQVDYLENQVTKANTRLPYHSTLLQLGSGCPYGNMDVGAGKGPCFPNPAFLGQAANAPRGDKTSTSWAQQQVDYLEKQITSANTRLPYKSTLLQLDAELETGCPYGNMDVGAGKGPCFPNPAFLGQEANAPRGDKTSTSWAQQQVDYLEKQITSANTRKPYVSTLL